jgi:hypothetical protein
VERDLQTAIRVVKTLSQERKKIRREEIAASDDDVGQQMIGS